MWVLRGSWDLGSLGYKQCKSVFTIYSVEVYPSMLIEYAGWHIFSLNRWGPMLFLLQINMTGRPVTVWMAVHRQIFASQFTLWIKISLEKQCNYWVQSSSFSLCDHVESVSLEHSVFCSGLQNTLMARALFHVSIHLASVIRPKSVSFTVSNHYRGYFS